MTVWTRKSGELASASARDFERLALPLLRAFWPALIHPRELSGLDRAGIDLVIWSDSGEFPVVVQCKGLYQEETLVSAQLPQIRKSIESFRRSRFKCQTYLLLHNRTGEDRIAHKEILELLNELVQAGKATNAELWDRQTFLKNVKLQLKGEIANRIVKRAKALIESNKRFFRFGGIHVDPVPLTFERWRFRQAGDIERELTEPEKLSPSQVLGTKKRTKWTLLIGHFGLGKSTFALHAATSVSDKLVYVHSSELLDKYGGVGTNHLMQEVLRSHPLFDEVDDVAASEFNRLGGTLLRELLSNPKEQFALVIDGLDESARYSSAQGLIQLTNELEELSCPKVLVTRKEHFEATFGNFKAALSEMTLDDLSVKGGAKRQARICCLEEWTDIEVVGFLTKCYQCAEESEKAHIQSLIDAIKENAFEETLGSLVRHPLFLQMIVSVASEGHSIPEHPATLIESWVHLKIRRDIQSGRPVPWQIVDIDAFVEEIIKVMEDVALELVDMVEGAIELREDISGEKLYSILSKREHSGVDPSGLVNVSLLVPAGRRQGKDLRLKFYHRVLQEYFLARQWRLGQPESEIPQEVSYWITSFGEV
ncbi:MAG TPA: hypothetical protein ENK96_05410 [Desulfobulbaceae bacterium]|nr:hypothetical protein [Desulfobulbaceae bacterium]